MNTSLKMVSKIAGIAALFTLASAASAAATRTWVSGVGDDANPCSRTAPCKTFAGAISKTDAGGEINVLDAGGFGAVTITKSISIIAEGVLAGILVSGTNGVIVNAAATDKVLLQGLDFEGLGSGLNGVQILGGNVVIRKCSIRDFTQSGVNLVGVASSRVLVQDSVINNNAVGVNVTGAGGVTNNGIIDRTTIDNNTTAAVQIGSPGGIYISASELIGAGPKLVIGGGGTITSYGNNIIRGGSATTPSATLPLQ